MIGYKETWIGVECEGRLSDIETLFVGSLGDEFDMIASSTIDQPHIYFCSPAVEQMIELGEWNDIFSFIQGCGKLITFEVPADRLSEIPAQIRNLVHIMYMFYSPDFDLLKSNDSVKVVHGDYKLHCITKCNMQSVTPDGYKHDR
jgi:hypothetical protein